MERPRRVLVTGGAGFVGSHLALTIKRDWADCAVIALDNLHRRGSELALPRLRAGGVSFVHGDVRAVEDLAAVGPVDLLIECSAEPSVHAGYGESPLYLVQTNLVGLVNCLEHLRRTGGDLLFLSTSRVYPIAGLRALPLERRRDRLDLPEGAAGPGWSGEGIAEDFQMQGSRSLYGATKLAGELLIEEYRAMYGLRAVVNRCGVLAGPWQMGKVDQGFIALWVARHRYGGVLAYSGFGGDGHQVRDLLHVDDLASLCQEQVTHFPRHDGGVYNVGGGTDISTSLRELTALCREVTGREIPIASDATTRPADIPYYVSDTRHVRQATGWQPKASVRRIVEDVDRWLVEGRDSLQSILSS